MLLLPSPAKLNLFLRITGRRNDGYHEIQTLFQLLDYGDELAFELRTDGAIAVTTNNPDLDPQTNLVNRAAFLLKQQSSSHLGVNINLIKRLPLGGGLGGGSSNAATTLIGLNKIWNLGYKTQQLEEIGLMLGADVPLFVHGRTAWAEGVGEQLESVDMPQLWYLVLIPDCQVDTAAIFNDQQLTRNSPPITIRAFREHGAENSCQKLVEKCYPAVKTARIWLQKYAKTQMSGTGSCLFASFSSQAQAMVVLKKIPEQWHGFVAQGVNHSPVYL
jgi:4-diphosphocytidyl-2-C-methyl-D-erythritol kinase